MEHFLVVADAKLEVRCEQFALACPEVLEFVHFPVDSDPKQSYRFVYPANWACVNISGTTLAEDEWQVVVKHFLINKALDLSGFILKA